MAIGGVERTVPLGDFRRIVVEEIRRLLVQARLEYEVAAGDGFVKRDPTLLIRHVHTGEIVAEIKTVGAAAVADFPKIEPVVRASIALADRALAATSGNELVALYGETMDLHGVGSDSHGADDFHLVAQAQAVVIGATEIGDDGDGVASAVLASDRADREFLAATANVIARARRAARPPTRDEEAAVAASYRLLDRGVQFPGSYQGIGVYGFRRHQTSLSLANPGEGHITVTCAHRDLLDGTIVHIEHIERDGVSDREKIEPYRLPAALNAARVRLHVGAASPCTAYVGRPIFENGVVLREGLTVYRPVAFEHDLLKSVHMTASACTAMFVNGVADCKIAIERMSYRQSVVFMRAVAGNVARDPTRQYLSAAININLPIWDDRAEPGRLVTDRHETARLGIEMALEGRFEKVTWDGASNQVPSVPIIEQLPFDQWVELVHEAHERGLETYISAGLVPKHMRACVLTGVDGVGIGTSLHYRHPQTNAIGQLKPEAIREVLRVRDAAAAEPLGEAARLLARFDRMFFEGTLPTRLETVRRELFEAIRAGDSAKAAGLMQSKWEMEVSGTQEHPLVAQAQRLISSTSEETVGEKRFGADAWQARVNLVGKLLEAHDLTGLEEVFL